MKLTISVALVLALGSCASRDDKAAMANIWHMGKALELGCSRPDLVGKELRHIADRHSQQHKYEIDKQGVRHVGSN